VLTAVKVLARVRTSIPARAQAGASEQEGEAGLSDRRLGCVSATRVAPTSAAEVEALCRPRYNGFTARHFHKFLVRDHQFTWGYTWTKAFLQSKGRLVRAKTRGAHRRKRTCRQNGPISSHPATTQGTVSEQADN
jgi:hypothetical protein